MDGSTDLADWLPVIRGLVAALAGLGSFSIFQWFRNGKTRRNALEMTPGHAPCCINHLERITRLEAQSDTE